MFDSRERRIRSAGPECYPYGSHWLAGCCIRAVRVRVGLPKRANRIWATECAHNKKKNKQVMNALQNEALNKTTDLMFCLLVGSNR
jgi:hypothetical protein